VALVFAGGMAVWLGCDGWVQKIVYNFLAECLNGVIPAHRRPFGVAMAVYFLPTD
jgi:hypothetical protein